MSRLDRDGQTLQFAATDSDDAWLIKLGGGFAWERGRGRATAAVHGTVSDLLLLTYGRLRPTDAGIAATGDRELLDAWLAATAF
ncbi:hypothetical protein AB0O76_05355 [Streptomyces sp. NPDC086554]|uniref:hypothetical protein n=1 Tax=Streptomyces sp. NPDC086554 TaxID=3154864 RepID=UPI003439F131